jgi:RNA polymerase sigma factor (sigma-70 family)
VSTDAQCLDLGSTFVAHHSQLRAAAQKILGTRELADEVAQDAFLKLSDPASTVTARQPLAYCYQVVRNLAIDHRRRMALESSVFAAEEEGADVPTPQGTPERYAINRQNLRIIEQALDELPDRTRRAFEMYRLGDLTQREIGQRLGVSAALVNAMIRDATEALMRWRHLLLAD